MDSTKREVEKINEREREREGKKMEKNMMRKVIIGVSLMLTILSGVVAENDAVEPQSVKKCIIVCAIECIIVRAFWCIPDCLTRCRSHVPEALSTCTFSCTDSKCSNFTSGV